MSKTNTVLCLENILSIAFKQTKAGSQSSGTPVIVSDYILYLFLNGGPFELSNMAYPLRIGSLVKHCTNM